MLAALTLVLANVLAITPHAMRAHVNFLASDVLEGRETGTRGYDVAASYVAAQFEAVGAEPAGDGGTYFHRVPMRSYLVDIAKSSLAIDGKAYAYGKDVLFGPGIEPARDVEAQAVFVGFGVTAPELQYDDYAGVDVRGKIVVLLQGSPPQFPHSQRAYYSNAAVKYANAVARGAVGAVNARTLASERRYSWERTVAAGESASLRALDAGGVPMETFPQLRGTAGISPAAAAELFGKEKYDAILADAEKGVTRAYALNKRIAIHIETAIADESGVNVVAMVRGSELPDEHVVISAHLDHVGINPGGGDEDRIRNGALDNASGIAALIEIARAAAAMQPRPRRSIVFAAVTGEEKGMPGSMSFAARPPMRGTIVANLNMDMITMLFPMKTLVALGIEHSTLAPLARAAAERNGFTIQDDPLPEEVRFVRSDQFSFVKQGIPAISYKGGLVSSDPAIDGDKLTRDWLRSVYHTVDDEVDQQLDYDSGARWARTNLDLAVLVANAKERPRWNAGDFFGGKFGR